MEHLNIKQQRRENLRASILQILYASHPVPASTPLIISTLYAADSDEQVGPDELRRQLDYLEEKALVRIKDRGESAWKADLTALGIDVVEGSEPMPPGIARIRY